MKIITIVSAKGGVGKTSVTANLASVLVAKGQRVLALDLDPQNALRLSFGIPLDGIDGLARATLGGAAWQTVMFDGVDGVTVLPFGTLSEEDHRRFESYIERNPSWLAHGLAALKLHHDDIVLVDTPPGSSPFTRAALSASHFALTVVLADAASYAVIPQMERLIDSYAAVRPDFVGQGYLINQVDQAKPLTKDVLKVLRDMLGQRMFSGVIHQDEGISEALACGTTVIHYDPLSRAAVDFRSAGDWLLEIVGAMSPARSQTQ